MFDLKVCTVCLQKDVKIYNMNTGQLRKEFNLISGLNSCCGNGLPEYLCFQCVAYVRSCKKFRDKCQRAYFALQEILKRNKEITKSIIEELDSSALNIGPTLSYLDPNKVKNKFENARFKWIKKIRMNVEPQENIPVLQHAEPADIDSFETLTKKAKLEEAIKNENSEKIDEINETFEYGTLETEANTENLFDDDFDICGDNNDVDNSESAIKVDTDVDGTKLDEEYATMVPITIKEANAVVDVCKLFPQGKNQCMICGKAYNSEKRLEVHMRMHEKHVSGTHMCKLCSYHYKTEFLLKTHMTEKHMYKYLCRKCPEVSFDRRSAKQHYIWTHLQKGTKRKAVWCNRPKWLSSKGVKREKLFMRPVRKLTKLPSDFPIYSPISQEEQYALVRDRQNTRNYTESPYKCEYCYKGFREVMTFTKHLQKHDPRVSGRHQCDVCKVYCSDLRKMYKHMNMTHLFKYSCQMCSYVCFNKSQAKMHYRWHKNVTYSCPHCEKVFTKVSTRLTHIRIKHPSTIICNLCGHSFVSENGLYCHKKMAHSKEEVENSRGTVDTSHPLYCEECDVQFRDDAAFTTHFGSSNKHANTNLSIKPLKTKSERPRGRPRRDNSDIVNTGVPTSSTCEICKKYLANDVAARRHYESEHPGAEFLKRYMCDICGHTTKQYANLMVHMRTHTLEKPYACPHCERRFSMPSNRDRHLVVHTGEKRYQCQHCNRRFTQSSAVKLHIQTVHMKIPYAPWDKKNRKRRRDADVAPLPPAAPAHKLVLDAGNYLSAYITYNE